MRGVACPAAKAKKNAFRSDDPEAEIPQHNWRQGPDYRSARVEDAGFAAIGSNRPKQLHGGDAPSARVVTAETDEVMDSVYEEPAAKQSTRKKGGGPGHEIGLGGRPRKLTRQKKKMNGVRQGYGRW